MMTRLGDKYSRKMRLFHVANLISLLLLLCFVLMRCIHALETVCLPALPPFFIPPFLPPFLPFSLFYFSFCLPINFSVSLIFCLSILLLFFLHSCYKSSSNFDRQGTGRCRSTAVSIASNSSSFLGRSQLYIACCKGASATLTSMLVNPLFSKLSRPISLL